MKQINLLKGSTILLSALILTACGGGESPPVEDNGNDRGAIEDDGRDSVPTVVFTGVVADGYLVNAVVCLDLNNNKVCDAGEPSDITTTGGAFSISATQDQIDSNPVILEATAGITIDEDTNLAMSDNFTLTAPSGSAFVSPLTTLVLAEIEANTNISGYTIADASAAIQTALGSKVDVQKDYISEKISGNAEASDYQRLHEIAQVATQVIATNIEVVATAAVEQNSASTEGEQYKLVIAELNEDMGVISAAVDADTSTTFDPQAVVAAVSADTAIDTTAIDTQVLDQKLEESAVIADLGALVSSPGGLNWVWVDYENSIYNGLDTGTITYNAGTDETTDVEYDVQSDGSLVVLTPGLRGWALAPLGWVSNDEKVKVSAINPDGSINWDLQSGAGETYSALHISGQLIDVSGETIAPFIVAEEGGFDATVIVGNSVFRTGAEAHHPTFTTTQDLYVLSDWDGCPDPSLTGGSCNTVIHQNGDGNSSNDEDATTMSAIIEPSAANPSIVLTDASLLNAVEIGQNPNLRVEMVSDGSANFYTIDFASNAATKVDTGTWEQRTVSGETLYLIDVPASLQDNADVYPGNRLLLAERNGFVRRGKFEPTGSVDSSAGWVFNEIAWQDILDNYAE